MAPPPRADITGPAPAAPRRADSPSLSPGQGNGWLSELLHRASKPDDAAGGERPARHTLESLDSLSVDIARMIDHDAAAELWDRYKRGERNVFTKRLYTMQGQKTFDEIRKKYRGDANSSRRWTATSASSSGCSRRSRTATAARSWRAPT